MRLVLFAALSVDGFITRHNAQDTGFLSSFDQEHLKRSLAEFDASIMGANTFKLFQGKIISGNPDRLRIIRTRDPAPFKNFERPGSLEFSSLSAEMLVNSLREREVLATALLGGTQNYQDFLKSGLVDELWITVEPVVLGKGLPLAGAPLEIRLEWLSGERLGGGTLLNKYRVVK